jgi:secreted Zn-dependent insulinase-like peptidase
MPRAEIQLVFLVPGLFVTPKLKGYFSVYTDALVEKVTAVIGYEAVLSDISYSIKSFENLGFKLKFSGYNDKLIRFVEIFLELMLEVRERGLDEMTVRLAVEKSLESYRNLNVEVDQRTSHNRLIFLLENVFHASLVIKELE